MLAPGYLGYITAPAPEICLLGVGKGPVELGSDRIYGTSQALPSGSTSLLRNK